MQDTIYLIANGDLRQAGAGSTISDSGALTQTARLEVNVKNGTGRYRSGDSLETHASAVSPRSDVVQFKYRNSLVAIRT